MSFEAVLYRACTGVPWRDLPAEFGAWDAVYDRLRRWIHSGGLKNLFDAMAERAECEDVRRLMIDSTVVRPSARRRGGARKGGGATQALGRSRGGSWTKVIAVACDEDGVVATDVAEDQRDDAPRRRPS